LGLKAAGLWISRPSADRLAHRRGVLTRQTGESGVRRKGRLPQRLKPPIEWREPAGLPDSRAELSREVLLRQACGDQLSQRLPILLPVLPWCDAELALWHEGLRPDLGKDTGLPEIRVRVDHDL